MLTRASSEHERSAGGWRVTAAAEGAENTHGLEPASCRRNAVSTLVQLLVPVNSCLALDEEIARGTDTTRH